MAAVSSPRPTLPTSLWAALGLGMAFMVFVGWDHSHWWRHREDYGFGWLVPIFVVYVVRERWSRLLAAVDACGGPESPRAGGWTGGFLTAAAYASMVVGALFFLLGAFYRAGAGPSHPGSQALAMGLAALLLPLAWLNAPDSPSIRRVAWWRDARWAVVGVFVFPCLVWLVSAPLVSVVENRLSLFLLNRVMAVVFFLFDTLGLPLQQEGNVLVLPPVEPGVENRVGVEQACSGIRSLTGCIFAGSFLAAVFLEKWWKKIALVGCALGLAFLTNLARSIFLTAWAYRYGSEAIEGAIHDWTGFAILGLTVVGLLALLPLFSLRIVREDEEGGEEAKANDQ
jgi:exosortase/archaeosortase family protein